MLAEMTAKLFFIETLRKYKLVVDSKTEVIGCMCETKQFQPAYIHVPLQVPLVTQCGITFSPKNGVNLKIAPRS